MLPELFSTDGPIVVLEGKARVRYWPAYLPESEADALFARLRKSINWQGGHLYIHGKNRAIPRLFQWYGERDYSYSGRHHQAVPLPGELDELRRGLEETLALRFNSVLCNLYRNENDSVAMHSDNEAELGVDPAIASLSLGETRRFVLRNKATMERLSLELAHGSLLLMAGQTQSLFEHGIPRTRARKGERINLTFRWIYEQS